MRKKNNNDIGNRFFVFFIFFMFLVVSVLSIVSKEIDKKEIKRLEKQNKELYIKVHNYEWMTDQYKYMFDNYCGGMNK